MTDEKNGLRNTETQYLVQLKLKGGLWSTEAALHGDGKREVAISMAKRMQVGGGKVRVVLLNPVIAFGEGFDAFGGMR